jgi:hypothetical protein
MNAEIYRPPYLFRPDGSGLLAERPTIVSAGQIRYGQSMLAEVGLGQRISKVTLVRSGSVTHSFDQSQRFVPLAFEQTGSTLRVQGPPDRKVAPPGTYMLFVLDDAGVPSIARIVQLPTPEPEARPVQTGTFDLASQGRVQWIRVAFERAFSAVPVVVIGQVTENGGDPVTTRVRNVTRTGFEVSLDEWDYLDGRHATERVTFLAAEPGTHDLDGLTLQAMRLDGVGAKWQPVRFATPFAGTPVALAQRASARDPDPAVIRLDAVGPGGLRVRLQSEEAGDAPGAERVDVIAVSQGRGRLNDLPMAVTRLERAVDERWSAIGYGRVYPETPHILAGAQSSRGGNPVVMRSANAMRASVDLRLQEETSADAETDHLPESIGMVSIRRR